MHEIGALTEAVKLAERVAVENQINRVKFITLEVGELSGYLPVFFEKYFPIVTEGNALFEEAALQIHTLCCDCHALYHVMTTEGACPGCGSREKKVLGGKEFIVKEIGY